jgi:hypothetical protein
MTAQVITPKPVEAIRSELRRKYQDAFDDGARYAFLGEQPGEREPGGYPKGFLNGRAKGATRGLQALILASSIACAASKRRRSRMDDRPPYLTRRMGRAA